MLTDERISDLIHDNGLGTSVASIRRSRILAREIEAEVAAPLQAKIDELMLEYCPEDMSDEQVAEWGRHQRPVSEAEVRAEAQEPRLYCNKCGYFGPSIDHGQPLTGKPCDYFAVTAPQPLAPCPAPLDESRHCPDCEALQAKVAELEEESEYYRVNRDISGHAYLDTLRQRNELVTKLSEQSAEIERLTKECDNIKQVEFPRRLTKAVKGWRKTCGQQAERIAELEQNGRVNSGDGTGGTVLRFGFDCTVSPPEIMPATNGAYVHYSSYLELFKQLAAIAAQKQTVEHHHKLPDTNGFSEETGDLSTTEKDAARYRWLSRHAYVGECYTENGKIFDVQNTDREVPIQGPIDAAIDAVIAKDAP